MSVMSCSKQGRSKSNVTLFCIMLVPFALSTGYWAVEFAELLVKIEVFFMNPAERNGRNITYYSTMWNAIALLNVSPPYLPIQWCTVLTIVIVSIVRHIRRHRCLESMGIVQTGLQEAATNTVHPLDSGLS